MSFIDSDSYVVVGKDQVVAESQAAGQEAAAARDSASGAGSRGAHGREVARDGARGEGDS